MKLTKNRNAWVSAVFCLIFCAAIYPYGKDPYVPDLYRMFGAFLNLCSGVLFSILLFLKLEGRFPGESIAGWLWYLFLPCPWHILFSMMNWGSWVCLGATGLLYIALWLSWWRLHPPKWKLGRRGKIALVIMAAAVLWAWQPINQARLFVFLNGNILESRLLEAKEAGEPEKADISVILSHNFQEGEQDMMEFMLGGKGLVPQSSYYGCYYSYEDVPLPFHNADLPLTPTENGWSWQGEGDNRGRTQKIKDHWYYFEAHY